MVPELNEETVCELPMYSYRILYEIRPAGVEVLALIHKRQNSHTGRGHPAREKASDKKPHGIRGAHPTMSAPTLHFLIG